MLIQKLFQRPMKTGVVTYFISCTAITVKKRLTMAYTEKAIFSLLIVFLGCIWGQVDLPTLVPAENFNPDSDAGRLDNAISGWGTDEEEIINVLCYRTFEQRHEITRSYNSRYGNLIDDLKGDTTGDFQILLVMLTHDKSTFLAIELHETIAGPGTNEPALTEVLMSRTNQELADVRNTYGLYYGTSLIGDIENDTIGTLRQLLTLLAEGIRDESTVVDPALVMQDVLALYAAGEGNNGTDHNIFIDVFARRNWLHLRQVSYDYDAAYGSLEAAIISEFRDETGNALFSILQYSRNKAAYFASRFHWTVDGAGTKDRDLKRLTVSRCETDLENIKTEYETIYDIPLRTAVADDTSGDYQRALLALIG